MPLEEVRPGDRIVVLPGERFPVDATIVEGRTTVDESMLTGESTPLAREVGGRVLAGSMNYDGAVVCRAESLGEATVLAQIARMVEQAQSSRAPMERLADRASAIFVPVVLGLAAVTFAGVADCGALAAAGAGEHGGGAGDCVPVRDGTGGACRADGGGGARRAAGSSVQRRRSAGAAGASGCGGAGQDGDDDGGKAADAGNRDQGTGNRKAGNREQGTGNSGTTGVREREDELAADGGSGGGAVESSAGACGGGCGAARGLSWEPAQDVQILPGRGLTARVEGRDCVLGNETLLRRIRHCAAGRRCGAGAGRDAVVDGAGRRGGRIL